MITYGVNRPEKPSGQTGSPAIFLDRDGTVIADRGYLADPDDIELLADAADGLRQMSQLGWPLVIVTNQSGISRGYFSNEILACINRRLNNLLLSRGIHLSGIYVCPHLPADRCRCRKPQPGLAHAAASDLGIELAQSFVIGDKLSDIGLAESIGATGILISSSYKSKERISRNDSDCQQHGLASDLKEAAEWIKAQALLRS
jgi:D-glycero-D-manno-heptose 1,7-bisphosphate phosphatase